MPTVDLLDISERGNEDFEELTDIEKDLYVLFLFVTLYEMEGVTHFFSHHLHQLTRLLSFMVAIQAPNEDAVRNLADFLKTRSGESSDAELPADSFFGMSSEDESKLHVWGQDFYAGSAEMWVRAKEYLLATHHFELR